MKILLVIGCLLLVPAAQAQTLPFYDGFDDGNFDGWTVTDDPEPQSGPSNWFVQNGMLRQTSNIWSYGPVELETKYHLGTHITTGNPEWEDYSLNVLARSTDNDGLGLIFRYQDAENYYRVLLMNDPAWSGRDSAGVSVNTPLQRIQKFVDGEPVILAENKVAQAYPDGYFALTADVRGDTIRAYLNGAMILQAVDGTYERGRVGMLSYANSGVYYDSVSVTGEVLIYDDADVEITYPVLEDRAPYLQLPTQTSIMVAWRTVEANLGMVRYSQEKDVLDLEAAEPEARQKHHVELTDLEPGTRYHYEVYSGGERIQTQERFRTAPGYDETQFSFLVLGDSGVDTPTQWALGDEMLNNMQYSEVDFMVHVGDVHQGTGDHYDPIYFKPYRRIINKINVFTALGNHDVITDNGAVYLDDFYLPRNNPDSTERYYSFRWANAYFIALDTNGNYAPGSPQYTWLVETLNDSLRQSATWTFVYAHHPPYSEYWTNYYGERNVQDYLVPLFEEYDVDMVMNGHTHSYERGEKNHVHYIVSGGGGGALDDYFIDYDHISFSEGVHHFTRIDVDGDEMWVTAIDEHGQQVDRFLINKFVDVGVAADAPAGDGPALLPGYPNPTRGAATFSYRLDRPGRAVLELFDLLGRKVGTLVDRRHQAGSHEAVFDASVLAPGVYVLRFTANDFVQSRTLTVVP